jgi:hypothetical protein
MQLNKWGKDLTVEEAESLGLIQKSEPKTEPKVTRSRRKKEVTTNDNNTTN